MKFSVLLPTRNGGPFLRNCIGAILANERQDFELVISDNANTDETPAIIAAFAGDPRVRVLRLETPVSVTDNWNNALKAARGDYLLMMGDDDMILPGYFETMSALIDRYNQPDCILCNAYSFVAPGSLSDDPRSLYGEAHFQFQPPFAAEQVMSQDLRRGIVQDMFRFRMRIPLNMQTTLVARRAAEKVRGGLFQPPFPDHFGLNALLLSSGPWVFTPEKLLVVGISPKSFGHYVYSNQQAGGLGYLGIEMAFPGHLPGNELINGMHAWLKLLKDHYPDELKGVSIDRAAYVRHQVYAWTVQHRMGALTAGDVAANLARLSPGDWLGLASTVADGPSWARIRRLLTPAAKGAVGGMRHGLRPLEGVSDIRQFGDWLSTAGTQAR